MANIQPSRRTCLIAISLVTLLIINCTTEKQAAPELLGRWTTNNRRYQGCAIEISKDTIAFVTVDGVMDKNDIDKIEIQFEKGTKVYQIHYSDKDDNDFRLSVVFFPDAPNGQLQLYNQKYLRWNSMGRVRQER